MSINIINQKKKLRFHIHGLYHTQTTKQYNSCAFTMQLHSLCDILKKAGHTVYHYGNEGSDPNCTENIIIESEEELKRNFADGDGRIKHPEADCRGTHPEFVEKWNTEVIKQIGLRIKPNDFILNIFNTQMQAIGEAFKGIAILVEPGVGYAGACPNFRHIYVSHMWESYHNGWHAQMNQNTAWHPEVQDAVIHYFVDEEDFEYKVEKSNYAFFIGRFNQDKGVKVALNTVEAYRNETGDKSFKLKMAGAGHEWFSDQLTEEQKEWVEILGYIDPDEKKELLANAKVLFAATFYNEPFGAISIEAQISGTPVITTDWGGFVESVLHGYTGFRCRTHEQFIWALKNIDTIKPEACREWALNNFTKTSQSPKYIEYFTSLHRMHTHPKQWFVSNNEREELDWLKSKYPKSVCH